MTIEEIFSAIASHMRKGLTIHEQISFTYSFLGLYGEAECHKYRYFEENKKYFSLRNYYMEQYHKLLLEKEQEAIEIIPDSWVKYEQQDVDGLTRKNKVKELSKKWVLWEIETKKVLAKACKELEDIEDYAAASYIQTYLDEVSEEFQKAFKEMLSLETIDYDIVEIMRQQDARYELYHKKLQKIF